MIYLDTHVLVLLYAGRARAFSKTIDGLLDRSQLLVSPIVLLELHLLYEIGKIAAPGGVVLERLQREVGLAVCDAPFQEVIETAAGLSWTRDPFDRIIVGQAALRDKPLVTKDETIREHYRRAVW